MWPFSSSTDQLVRKIKATKLFSPDLPKREQITHAQWANMAPHERTAATDLGSKAISMVPNFLELVELIKELGDEKHKTAVPILSELWQTCAVQPVRTAAGYALGKIDSLDARTALVDLIEDHDSFSVYMAVHALFADIPKGAFDRCAKYFTPLQLSQPGGEVIPNEILRTFAPTGFSGPQAIPQWTEPRAPQWLKEDERWLDLCVSYRKHELLGYTARNVLRYADKNLVGAALSKAKATEPVVIIQKATKAQGDLLSRYQKGEHELVWAELRAFESIGGDLLIEASAVAEETMKRVAHNADLLAERFQAHDWRPLYGELRTLPQGSDQETIIRMEQISGGSLPLSLKFFWTIVGGLNFVWDYNSGPEPDLGLDMTQDNLDPLCVGSAGESAYLIEEWEYQCKDVDPELWDPFLLELSPDNLHKANISGGSPYGVELPFPGVDPIFAYEPHKLPFTDYLRLAFKCGGFPGLLECLEDKGVQKFLAIMTKDLEPF
jgi:hypothetical protein